MVIREHRALKAYIKIVLCNLRRTHVAAAGVLGSVAMYFKNHDTRP